MNVIQFVLIVSAAVIGLLGPYLRTYDGVDTVYNIVACVALGCMLADIIIGIIFIVKYKEEREILISKLNGADCKRLYKIIYVILAV